MDPIKIQPNQNGPHEKKQLKGEGPKVSAKESSRKKTKESENSGHEGQSSTFLSAFCFKLIFYNMLDCFTCFFCGWLWILKFFL